MTDEIKITPHLNDKLKVIHDVMREMRDEDLEVIPKLVAFEKKTRVQLNALLPVEPKEERREEVTTN